MKSQTQVFKEVGPQVVKEADGSQTVHLNGIGNPGKIYGCSGEITPWEAIEDAQNFVERLREALREKPG